MRSNSLLRKGPDPPSRSVYKWFGVKIICNANREPSSTPQRLSQPSISLKPALLKSVLHQVHFAREIQFAHGVGAVALYCLHTYLKLRGDFLIGIAISNLRQHKDLAGAQAWWIQL